MRMKNPTQLRIDTLKTAAIYDGSFYGGDTMKQNFQLLLDKEINRIQTMEGKPTLLLHSCCAPCSSYVLEYLSQHFDITVLYYNPNIAPREEFERRAVEQERLIAEMPLGSSVRLLIGEYEPDKFLTFAAPLAEEPEGGERCQLCYRMRLEAAAKAALEGGYDYFTTTLSISPHKNAQKLNEIGEQLSRQYGVPYLYADFKKKNGYKRSCELSVKYNLYRQDYCGCVFSKAEAMRRQNDV